MNLIHRQVEPLILKALKTFPAVYINGPRQSGKTTLVRELIGKHIKGKFLTFDDSLERSAAFRNPLGYLRESGYPLVIDEVQMVPEIFRPLKVLIDEQRFDLLQKGQKPNGYYVLTGSANLMIIPELADAMVGRMGTITLLPLSASEYFGNKHNFIDRAFEKDWTGITNTKSSIADVINMATFPELGSMGDEFKASWFQNYIRKITLEDPQHIYNLEKSEYMPILLQALATRAGSLINDADISRDVGLTAVTAKLYRGILNGTFITYDLSPWYKNINKRLVKAHKLYFYDTLLLSYLLGSTPKEMSKLHPQQFGHLLENFILSELTKANNTLSFPATISFYRTREGKEVDFILERQGKMIGIEVKNSERITDRDLSGLRDFQSVSGNAFAGGIILCNTPRVINYGENIYLVPFEALWS